MNRAVQVLLMSAIITLVGCQRPEKVREVATLSKPIAVRLLKSGAELAARMSTQTAALALRAETLSSQQAAARQHANAIERDFRLLQDEDALRQLAVIKEGDAELLADPLAPVRTASARREGAEAVKIDLAPLTKTVAALDRLSGAQRMSWQEAELVLKDAADELRKVEEESAKAEAPEPAPASPPQQ